MQTLSSGRDNQAKEREGNKKERELCEETGDEKKTQRTDREKEE